MAWTDTGRKAENGVNGAASLAVTLNSVAAGSFIAVATATYSTPGASTTNSVAVSDATNGAYTQAFFTNLAAGNMAVALHYFPSSAAGNLTITTNPTGDAADTHDIWIAVHEFAGGHATPASGTPATSSGTSAVASSGTMTPANNDVLLLAACVVDAFGAITENQAAQGFTLSNEFESGTGMPGSFVFKILSGAPGTPSHTWTLAASAPWRGGIAAFRPSVAAAVNLLVYDRGRFRRIASGIFRRVN